MEKYLVTPITATKNLNKKIVLLRVDFNVPTDDHFNIIDDNRIKAALSTINYLLENNAIVILITHFGDPEDKSEFPKLSLKNIQQQISDILSLKLCFCENLSDIKNNIEKIKNTPQQRKVILFENIRFFAEEKTNDKNFAKEICDTINAEVYVNDAFSVSHRNHASLVAIPNIMKEKYAGISLVSELQFLENNISKILDDDSKKTIAIIGGKKISTKLPLIKNLIKKIDHICLVGAMANTFLKAQGKNIGSSFFEPEMIETVNEIMKNYRSKIILPSDFIFQKNDEKLCYIGEHCHNDSFICDIGPETNILIHKMIGSSDLVLWNGPCGIYENLHSCVGTDNVARSIAYYMGNSDIISVIGGGDTVAVITKLQLWNNFTHISTAGGAFLKWLEGGSMPGLIAIC